jgi:hypothetical protein
MTKNEWRNHLRPGIRVTMTLPVINPTSAIYNKVFNGTVIKGNFNWSQVLVKWDDEETNPQWYGRLGIELMK